MNYIWNITKIEKINDNKYLIANQYIWFIGYLFENPKSLKNKEVLTYETLNVRNWTKTIYIFSSIEKYSEFLEIKEKTKWVNLKNISEFVSLTDYDKYQLINKKITIKGLGPSTIKKIQEVIDIEKYNKDISEIKRIKEFLKILEGTDEEKEKFILNNIEDLKKLDNTEIMKKYLEK